MLEHVQTRFGARIRAVFVYAVLPCFHAYLLCFDLMQAFSNIYETRRSLFLNFCIFKFDNEYPQTIFCIHILLNINYKVSINEK